MRPAVVVAAIRKALELRGTNPFRAARGAGLPGTAIRHVLEGKQPRLGRLCEICDALGLELYVGPPRPAITQTDARESDRRLANPTLAGLRQCLRDLERMVSLLSDSRRLTREEAAEIALMRGIVAGLCGAQVVAGGTDRGKGEAVVVPPSRGGRGGGQPSSVR